jgi:hypothetical protein
VPAAARATVVQVSSPRTEVELQIPRGLFGNDPAGLINYLGLQGQHIIGQRWTVRRPASAADVLTLRTLADETDTAHQGLVYNVLPPPGQNLIMTPIHFPHQGGRDLDSQAISGPRCGFPQR